MTAAKWPRQSDPRWKCHRAKMLSGDIFHGKTSRNEISHSWISQGEFTYGEIFPGEISQRGYFHAVKLPRCKISRRQIPGETSTQEGISDPDYEMLLPFDQLLEARMKHRSCWEGLMVSVMNTCWTCCSIRFRSENFWLIKCEYCSSIGNGIYPAFP